MSIDKLEPKEVFQWFKNISKIPHGSGNTTELKNYCKEFAKERNLEYFCDNAGNIIIFKEGSVGYEKSEPVILQGHLDMVCDHTLEYEIDMEKEALNLCSDGEFIWAEGTTLGADDGIGIAYILAVLDSNSISHPPVEVLFTSDEEIGMIGASNLDASHLKGRKVINIDSEKEGILTVSCAGGVRAVCTIPFEYESTEDRTYFSIKISGLKGGHSGVDISKHRKNSNKLMGRLIDFLLCRFDIRICSINGGTKDNAIAKTTTAVIASAEKDITRISEELKMFENNIRKELICEKLNISISECMEKPEYLTAKDSDRIAFVLMHAPDGICEMSPDMPEMVLTSLNYGIVQTTRGRIILKYLIRSNAESGITETVDKLVSFIKYVGGATEFTSEYPTWEYRSDSELRETMIEAYRDYYGKEPTKESIHAGLECAILISKIRNADIVSFGPDIENVHTPDERMNIKSAARCWDYLLRILKMLK